VTTLPFTEARKSLATALVLLALSLPLVAAAFSNNNGDVATESISTARTVEFAKQVEKSLASHGARVAFVARVGRPPAELPRGLQYTHVGLAVYSRISTIDGKTIPGYATYNLYQKQNQSNRSELVQDYMLDFFSGVQVLKAGMLIPDEKLQKKLLQRIVDGSFNELHNERYSLLSNPYNNRYQNCNEYLLNLIQASIYNTTDMQFVKQSIQQHFQAWPVPVNPLGIILGGLFRQEIAVNDHRGRFETVTFGSLVAYLENYDLAKIHYTLTD